jgi:predicted ATPase
MEPCRCQGSGVVHQPRLVVLTGGPGAGKTAVLEVIRRHLCRHVCVLPEAASILFTGGFPRDASLAARASGQRAIFHVQRELERYGVARDAAIVLCDRGTVDGVAYWPTEAGDLWRDLGATREVEIARYHRVIHLRTPIVGYNQTDPARIEAQGEAATLDAAIARAWEGHPRRTFVEATVDFMDKLNRALALVREELPSCCR